MPKNYQTRNQCRPNQRITKNQTRPEREHTKAPIRRTQLTKRCERLFGSGGKEWRSKTSAPVTSSNLFLSPSPLPPKRDTNKFAKKLRQRARGRGAGDRGLDFSPTQWCGRAAAPPRSWGEKNLASPPPSRANPLSHSLWLIVAMVGGWIRRARGTMCTACGARTLARCVLLSLSLARSFEGGGGGRSGGGGVGGSGGGLKNTPQPPHARAAAPHRRSRWPPSTNAARARASGSGAVEPPGCCSCYCIAHRNETTATTTTTTTTTAAATRE